MARELLTYIIVFANAVVFSQQEQLCFYRKTWGGDNSTRVISNGTIQEEGRFFITWSKACGSESLRFVCTGSCHVTFRSVETVISRSCSEIYVLDSLAKGYLGVVHTCPARTLAESFQGKDLHLRFEGMGNDSVEFEVDVSTYSSTSADSTVLHNRLVQRTKIISVRVRNFPEILDFSVDEPYYPGMTMWIIGSPSDKVSVNVRQADSTNCSATVVRVYDGYTMSEEALLGSFCDTKPFFLSSAGSLTIILYTNLTEPSGRFLLSYAEVPRTVASLTCNTSINFWGELNVTSPGFANLYPDRLDCWWLLRGPKGAHIGVQSQTFLLQPRIDSAPCTDWLAIYEGEDNSSTLLDKVCGSSSISHVFPQDSLLLWFHSDASFTAPGFSLKVSARDSDGRLYCDPDQKKEVLLGQGGYGFTLQAPQCFIQLRSSSQVVRLRASTVVLSPGILFSCKNLFVYDGPTKANPQLIHWCGEAALDVTSTGIFMYIELHQLGASVQLFADSEGSSTAPTSSASGFNIAALVGTSLCAVLFVAVCVLCCVGCCRVRSRQQTRRRWSAVARPNMASSQQNRGRRRPSLSQRLATVSERVAQRFVAAPPSYEAAVSGQRGTPPPPYSAVAENRVPQGLPPLDQTDKPPAYSDVGMEVEA